MSFGLHPAGKISAVDIELGPTSSSMDMLYGKRVLGRLTTPLVGMHNMYNTLAAIAVALSLGMGWGKIQSCLQQFRGVRRRLEQVGCIGPVPVFDDYAHHPTEIQATLKTLKSQKRRIIAIFQPHRYTRIQSLFSEFLISFDNADVLIVTPIYGAGEKTDRSLTHAQLYAALKESRRLPTFFAANPVSYTHLRAHET